MSDVNVIPENPPVWWQPAWGWPPHWEAKIDRDFEQHSDRDQARSFGERRVIDNLQDERHDTEAGFADARHAREEANDRAKVVAEAELRLMREHNQGVASELRAQRQQFAEAIWSQYLNQAADKHNLTMQVLGGVLEHSRRTSADDASDARLARAMNYDRATEKALNAQLARAVSDAVSVALKEVMATVPARSGLAAPVEPFEPTPVA